jgi:hypothetical protein
VAYRSPSELDASEDHEAIAIAELGSRARHARQKIYVPVLLAGMGVGVGGYVLLREVLLSSVGGHMPWLTAALTLAPAFLGGIRLAAWLADTVVARRLPGWRAELARAHGLDEKLFEETTQFV